MSLPLRDLHPGVAPSWWPPAPGWWWLAGALLLLLLVLGLRWARRRRRIRTLMRYFDDALAQAASPVEQVAVMSALLRRAARRIDPQADRLEGEAWLRFLDTGWQPAQFQQGPGALLGDGGFRRELDPAAVAALREVARRRYRAWIAGA